MYDFSTKKKIAARIADRQHIPVYRRLLESCKVPSSGMIMADKDALARDLVYMVLDKYTEEQILAACFPAPASAATQAPAAAAPSSVQGGPSGAVKKNSRSLRNILASTGRTWTTLSSGLRTAYSLTASTAGRVCAGWSSSCRNLWRTVRSCRHT